MIYVPKTFTISKVPFLAMLCAVAICLCFSSNHIVIAQRSDGPSPSTGPQPAVTLDDQFAAIARAVPSFGGLFIRDGHLNVYLTNPADLQAVMLAIVSVFGRTRLPLDNPVALQGRYNFAQLKAWHDLHRMTTLAIPGVQSVDIDERNNRLQIDVLSNQAESDVQQQLEQLRIPGNAFNISLAQQAPLIAERQGHSAKAAPVAVPVDDPLTLQDKWRPVTGGIQIKSSEQGICTLSFLAVRAHEAGFITCSHCTKTQGMVDNTVISQATTALKNRVGFETVDPPLFSGGGCPSGRKCRFSDAAFIKRDSTTDQYIPLTSGDFGSLRIPVDITTMANQAYLSPVKEYAIVGIANAPVGGEVLEKTGRSTGRTIGEVSNTCVDQNAYKKDANGNQVDTKLTMLCQDKMGALADDGDSGSPIYKWESSQEGLLAVRLYGLAWTSDGQSTWFSPMGQINNELGDLKTYKGQNPDSKPEVKIFKPVDNGAVYLPLGQPVKFEAAAVDFEDADLDFTWKSLDDNTTMGFGKSLSYVFGTPGVKHIGVIAKDSDNNTASYDITVKVAQNTPPTVTINEPVPNQVIHVGELFKISGVSSDPNEPGGQLACNSLSWSYQPTYIIWPASFIGVGCQLQSFKFSNAGYYTIGLTGTDSMGATGTATVDVRVVDADAPWAEIEGPIAEELQANQTTTLTGEGWDLITYGAIHYQWAVSVAGVKKGIKGSGTVLPNSPPFNSYFKPADYFPALCGTKPATVFLTVTSVNNGKTIEVSRDYLIIFGQCPMP